MNLNELTTVKQEECPVCIAYVYTLPCNVNDGLFAVLRVFGREKYPISAVSLFKIEDSQFYVECMAGTKQVKIWFKKDLGQKEIDKQMEVFENCLCEWLSDVFDSDIGKE